MVLNKLILDQGWFEFRRQREYMQVWREANVLAVPPRNIRWKCPCSGYVSEEIRQTQARFACMYCGYDANTDLVGAIGPLYDVETHRGDYAGECSCVAR